MRRLALCLAAAGLVLAGCSSDGGGDAAAPTTARAATRRPAPTTSAPPVTRAEAATPGAPAPPPPTTVAAAPPMTVDLCTEARTVAADFELTHEESAARFDALAARAPDPGFAAALQDLAAQFRAGASEVSTAGLDAHCP